MATQILLTFLSGAAQAVPNPLENKSKKKLDQKTLEAAKEAFKAAKHNNSSVGENTTPKPILMSGFAPNLEIEVIPEHVFEDQMGCSYEEFIHGNGYFDDNGDYHHIPGIKTGDNAWLS